MIDEKVVRKKGILLTVSRVDRNQVKELWLYKLKEVGISVYDPSSAEIKQLFTTTGEKKVQSILRNLCRIKKRNKRIRKSGKKRKIEKGLKTRASINRYIIETRKNKRDIKKKRKNKTREKY